MLLGDDIVLTDGKIAHEYQAILDELGVKVSPMKTHVSAHTYEFAKRWIHKGTEVSGVPFTELFQAIRFVSRDTPITRPSDCVKRVSYYEVATWFRTVEARWLPRSEFLVSRGLLAETFTLLG